MIMLKIGFQISTGNINYDIRTSVTNEGSLRLDLYITQRTIIYPRWTSETIFLNKLKVLKENTGKGFFIIWAEKPFLKQEQ